MDSRKLNLAASARGKPVHKAAAMVKPDRLMPGKMAKAWATPTSSAR